MVMVSDKMVSGTACLDGMSAGYMFLQGGSIRGQNSLHYRLHHRPKNRRSEPRTARDFAATNRLGNYISAPGTSLKSNF
jgi:hypothetical protein